MSSPVPTPPSLPPHESSRAARASLVAFGVALLALVAYRSYGPQVAARPSETSVATPVDVNAGDRSDLRQLPGVGPAMAERIASHREANGPFATVEELQSVPGVGPQTLTKLRPYLSANTDAERLERKPPPPPPTTTTTGNKLRRGDPPIAVNTADAATLQRLPGVGPTLAARIVEARADGPFTTGDDLRRVKGIGAKTLESLRPFVRCD